MVTRLVDSSREQPDQCPTCGAHVTHGAAGCPFCGSPLPPTEQATPVLRVAPLPLPVLRGATWISWSLLGLNAAIWLAMTVAGGSTDQQVLLAFGAKYGPAILAGEYWRLLFSSFLHIGLMHLGFNLYALYVLGPQVERYFGRARFLAIYLLTGVLSSATSYVISSSLAAGASGSIFGLVGALSAFFMHERKVFGAPGRRRLNNLVSVVAINLVIGFTVPNIDNAAHVGGLVAGLAVGWLLSPQYALVPPGPAGPAKVIDRNSLARSWWVIPAALAAVVGLTLLGNVRERSTPLGHYRQGEAHLRNGQWDEALKALSAALEADAQLWPAYLYRAEAYLQVGQNDAALGDYNTVLSGDSDTAYLAAAHAGRGRIYALRGQIGRALAELNRSVELDPQDSFARFVRGMIYYDMDVPLQATEDLQAALDLGLDDQRSLELAQQALDALGAARSAN